MDAPSHQNDASDLAALQAGASLAELLDSGRICGDLIGIDYSSATVLVHDKLRAEVGGVSKGCFLIASRLEPGSRPDARKEECSVVLLRVVDKAPLPNASDTERMRFDAGQRVSDAEVNWDDERVLDVYTANFLRYAGLKCRVVGTFMMRSAADKGWRMVFGADLANIYSGRGMKVYKPDGEALRLIANYVRPQSGDHPLAGKRIRVGRVRYAASEREGDTTGSVEVTLDPTDLVARRTALFGMSRTGKSNTVKVIASSIFGLRADESGKGRVGQLILDANGEYANENPIDKGALRRVAEAVEGARPGDVATYGLHPHPRDPDRRLVKLNFFGLDPQEWGDRDQVVSAMTPVVQAKQVVDGVLSQESAKYIAAFRNVALEVPEDWTHSARTRYQRTLAAYRAILFGAGLQPPESLKRARLDRLVGEDLRHALAAAGGDHERAAIIFEKDETSWDEALEGFKLLRKAIEHPSESGYEGFNRTYRDAHEQRDWHDGNLMGVLALLEHRGGMRLLGKVAPQHSPATGDDYADQIVADLAAGKLVIVDQSTGDPDMNEAAAERLMWRVFERQKEAFTNPRLDENGEMVLPPDVVVYVEEAHNLLPEDGDDLKGVWARVAKEGSKYRIGLVYATQEPSSIMTNILSNTDNWFVAHLNRGAEVKQVKDFYDFGDFEEQILQVPEPGFIRMRTLSNPYVVPVQIDEFVVPEAKKRSAMERLSKGDLDGLL